MLGLELLLTSTDSKCVLLVSQHGLKKVQELNTSQRVLRYFICLSLLLNAKTSLNATQQQSKKIGVCFTL